MKQKRIQSTFNTFIWSAYSMMITSIFPFLIRTAIIRFIGLEYAGVSSLFTSILQIINLTDLGFESAMTFFLYKPMAEQTESGKEQICSILHMLRRLYLFAGTFILIIGLACMPFIPSLIRGKSYPAGLNIYFVYFIYIINSAIPYFIGNYKAVLFKADQKSDILNRIGGTTAGIMYICQLVVLVIYADFYLYTILLLVSNILHAIWLIRESRRHYPEYKAYGWPDKVFIKDFKKQVFAIALSKLRTVTRNSFDSVVISVFLGLVWLAKYQNYYQVMQLLIYVVILLRSAVTPSLGNGIATESKDSNYGVLTVYTFLQCAVLTVLIGCTINLYQPFIVLWVGKKSLLPFPMVILFCVYIFAYGMSDIMVMLRETSGVWWKGRYISVVESISNLILNVLLVRMFGVGGVIFATIITIVCINLPSDIHYIFKYYFERSPKQYIGMLLMYTLTTILSTSVSYYLVSKIVLNGILGFLCKGILSFIVSLAMFLILQFKNPKLRELLDILKIVRINRTK
ncbi:hypothetical protein CPT75_03495 [Butyrivibrio fibrisolvens]|uniref:Membrane protein involved in the export of O-antigen and teichoic acid n=1 Tax=Butyrivibrio fibrisolvens TaxID=831 RepID=A0A317FZG5_BUTFI|nr:hypothetical protein CPT75_03495 [Butyrivibrio fibrisolvens]